MSEEELNRKMEFIIEQQAQFAVDIQKLEEKQNLLTDAALALVGSVGKLSEKMEGLLEAQRRTDEKLSELAARQSETDERLNSFINVVERYISNRQEPPAQ
jgi:chromosome segregation ATPase